MDWVNTGLMVALIGVTFWYARSTRDILRENQRLVRGTVALARTASQSLFLQNLPVLIAHSGGGTMSGDVVTLQMRYSNIGTGPALNAAFAMTYQGVDLLRLDAHRLVEGGRQHFREVGEWAR